MTKIKFINIKINRTTILYVELVINNNNNNNNNNVK